MTCFARQAAAGAMCVAAVMMGASVSRGEGAATDEGVAALKPAELTSHATIQCIGVQWNVHGDANANATGTIEYREAGAGEGAWKNGMALRRSPYRPNPNVPKGADGKGFENWGPDMQQYLMEHFKQNYLAGSLFGLKAGTKYEVRVTLKDPDGGGASQTIEVTTRAEPSVPKDGHVVEVTGGGDALKKAAGAAKAGDVLVVHAGKYDGGIEVKASGTAEKPICIKAAGDGVVLLYGGDAAKADLHGIEISGKYVWIEGVSFYNFNNCVRVGREASNAAVMHCRMNHFYTAIRSQGDDGYFADNVMRESYNALDQTVERGMRNEGHAIELGRMTKGNVNCYNEISLVADAFRSYGRDTDTYGNDVIFGVDDFIEFDDGGPNQRCWENRVSYVGENGVSFQPYIGGPAYVIRNVICGQKGNPIKNRYAAEGGVFINNTFIGNDGDGNDLPFGSYTRNNLFLVIPGKTRSLRVEVSPERLKALDMDYDGVGAMGPNGKSAAEFAAEAGLEKHAVQFGSDEEVLAKVPVVPEELKVKETWTVPLGFLKAKDRPHPDLGLKAGSRAIGGGVVVPNISEGNGGKAPDLGALEFGKVMPKYGVRE